MNEKNRSVALLLGAMGSFGIAVLHLVVVLVGAPGYRYFGAPDLAVLAAQGSLRPAVLTLLITAVFAIWGFYALAGAGRIRTLPLLRTAIGLIAAVYVLRGLLLIPEFLAYLNGRLHAPRSMVFSTVSLLIGLSYFYGLWELTRARTRAA